MSQVSEHKIRLAIAGAGAMGKVHMDVVRSSTGCTLSAIVDPLPSAVSLAAQIGVPLFPTIDALLTLDRPDGLILATPNALHAPQARQCMAAGVPILLEKPMATTVAEGEQLVQEVEQLKARVLIGHHRAHSPIMAKAREVIDSGQLGRLVAVMGSATFYKPDTYYAQAPWRSAIGGGPILLNLIHEVHNLRMLCGDVVAVQAFASHAVRGFPVEDTVAINLRFASGVLGTFLLSDTAACPRSWEQTSQENKAYAHEPDEDCYVITGTQGSLSVPTMRLKTYPRAEDRSWWNAFETRVVDLVRDDPLKHQLEHFCAMIRHEVEPLVSARDGLLNLRVTQAIAEAARTGQIVELNPH